MRVIICIMSLVAHTDTYMRGHMCVCVLMNTLHNNDHLWLTTTQSGCAHSCCAFWYHLLLLLLLPVFCFRCCCHNSISISICITPSLKFKAMHIAVAVVVVVGILVWLSCTACKDLMPELILVNSYSCAHVYISMCITVYYAQALCPSKRHTGAVAWASALHTVPVKHFR